MSDETIYDVYKAMKSENAEAGRHRVRIAEADFKAVSGLASNNGLVLMRHEPGHYSLRSLKGWILNIYPGNQRLYRDSKRAIKAPFLRLSETDDWSLRDVVSAAIVSLHGRNNAMPDNAFTEACAFIMPFGKHKHETLARIGSNDEGLKYLDWLIGRDLEGWPMLRTALGVYLKHPSNATKLDALLDD